MQQQSKPYLPSVIGFAAWLMLSYMIALLRYKVDMSAPHLFANAAIYAMIGAVYGLLVWRLILRPQLPTWIKGALLASSIGFCFYFFNAGVADTMASLLLCCVPVGAGLGALVGVGQSGANNLAKQRYVERNRG